MALTRPTLLELVTRIEADFVSRLALTAPLPRRSIVRVLARVLAGAVHMLYGAIEYLSRQIFADQSDAAYLERDASVYGLARTAPTYATATVLVTGTVGASVPAGALLQDAGGIEFAVNTGGTIPGGGTMSLAVTAVVYGAASSTALGATLNFESPVAGVQTATTVTAHADGTDRETVDAFRVRFLALKASRGGNGGSTADYIAWSKEVAGVTRVWVTPQGAGPGSVLVRFTRDGDVWHIPDAGEIAAVQAHLDTVKPASCALVQVTAPTDEGFPITLHITPDTPALRTAVEASLSAMLYRRMAPTGGTLYLAWIQTAVGDVAGVDIYSITTPTIDYTPAVGTLVRLGVVTWF